MTETCLCPSAVAVATGALLSGGDPVVLPCDHSTDDDADLCVCCQFGICGATRYVTEEGDLVYEHAVAVPWVQYIPVLSSVGTFLLSMN